MPIKSENILTVINNFKKIPPSIMKEDCRLDMSEGAVCGIDHPCGTIHCHGGWYAVVTIVSSHQYRQFNFLEKIFKKSARPLLLSFTDGARKMAIDLGFSGNGFDDLREWARYNEKLWGNSFGARMFSDQKAFYHPNKRPLGANNLQDIVDHWSEVYERVKATEAPQYPNITSELAVLPQDETSDVKQTVAHVAAN